MQRTQRLHRLRAAHPRIRLIRDLEDWQKERLERTYADLAANRRYTLAADFFVGDLYAPNNVVQRDADLERMYPTMVRLLPEAVLETIARALRLQADTLELDARIGESLAGQGVERKADIDTPSYIRAFADDSIASGRRSQIELVMQVGKDLDHYVHVPLIFATLKMARLPAKLAGLGELQHFLEKGFAAFRAMGQAKDFLSIILQRESAILEALIRGDDNPFDHHRLLHTPPG